MSNSYEILEDDKDIIPTVEKETDKIDLKKINENIETTNERIDDLKEIERKAALKEIDALEKRSGLNLDETQNQVAMEIENLGGTVSKNEEEIINQESPSHKIDDLEEKLGRRSRREFYVPLFNKRIPFSDFRDLFGKIFKIKNKETDSDNLEELRNKTE